MAPFDSSSFIPTQTAPSFAQAMPGVVTTGLWQRTLKQATHCTGIGVHSGQRITMRLLPAEPDTGITFFRTDLKNGARTIQARWDTVIDTRLCTVVGNTHGGKVATIEHLMAALRACEIDNILIEIDGAEVPVMDGSADPFIFLIEMAGVTDQAAPRRTLRVLKTVEIAEQGRWARLSPDDAARFNLHIDFAKGAITQDYGFTLSQQTFKTEIGRARTFGFFEEADQLRKMGLGLGASLDNTVVIKDNGIMNADGLRYGNEFVRHKLLDAVGDLALAGAPIRGAFQGNCTGHAMNNRLLHALFADPTAWVMDSVDGADARV